MLDANYDNTLNNLPNPQLGLGYSPWWTTISEPLTMCVRSGAIMIRLTLTVPRVLRISVGPLPTKFLWESYRFKSASYRRTRLAFTLIELLGCYHDHRDSSESW